MKSRDQVITYIASKVYYNYFSGNEFPYADVKRLIEFANFLGYDIKMSDVKDRFYDILDMSKQAAELANPGKLKRTS